MRRLKLYSAVLALIIMGYYMKGREIRNLVFTISVLVILGLNIETLIFTIPSAIAPVLKKVGGEPLLSYLALILIFISEVFFIRFILLIL